MKALFLTFLLLTACTPHSPVINESAGTRVKDIRMEITHLKEVEWAVGKRRAATVSQSFVFNVTMPKVHEEDLALLTKLYGVDAWILRLIVQRGSKGQDLGSLYAPFRPQRVIRGQSVDAPRHVSLKVYYASAYASERFRAFHCPAFGHDRRLNDLTILGDANPFELVIGKVNPYGEKSQLTELHPSAFNAGHSLAGDYFLEIAAYDSRKKVILGDFKRLPLFIRVGEEKRVPLAECIGEHPERK